MKSIRISGKLSDGRFARLELSKFRYGTCANLALVAHKSRRVCNDWLRGCSRSPADNVTTGSGLEVFSWALNALSSNIEWVKSHKIGILVIAVTADDRRMSAYRKLLKRYKIEVEPDLWEDDSGGQFIAIRI